MVHAYVNLLGCCCFMLGYVRTYEDASEPSWRKILNKLHNKVGEIYGENWVDGDRVDALSGKIFQYVLPGYDAEEFEVSAIVNAIIFRPFQPWVIENYRNLPYTSTGFIKVFQSLEECRKGAENKIYLSFLFPNWNH